MTLLWVEGILSNVSNPRHCSQKGLCRVCTYFKHRISPVALPSFQIAGDDDQVKYMHVEVKFMQCHLDNTTWTAVHCSNAIALLSGTVNNRTRAEKQISRKARQVCCSAGAQIPSGDNLEIQVATTCRQCSEAVNCSSALLQCSPPYY